MKTELRYIVALLLILLVTISGMLLLLKKYSHLTLQHFVEFCKETTIAFLSSGVHFIGILLLLTTFFLAFIFFAKLALSLIKTRRKIRALLITRRKNLPAKIQSLLSNLRINTSKIVIVEREAPLALSFGLFSPKILVSTGLIRTLSESQLEAVLLHESYHLHNKHPLLLIFGEVTAAVLFFIPFVKELVLRMRLHFEQKADEFTISMQGSSIHLRTALAQNIDGNSLYPYPAFADKLLKQRIDWLIENKIQRIITMRSIILSIITVVAGLVLLLFPTSTHASLQEPAGNGENPACRQAQCDEHCIGLDKRQAIYYTM